MPGVRLNKSLEERKMTKKKVGLVLFGIAIIWAFFWGILGSIHQAEFYIGVLTFEELNKTIWAATGPLISGSYYKFCNWVIGTFPPAVCYRRNSNSVVLFRDNMAMG